MRRVMRCSVHFVRSKRPWSGHMHFERSICERMPTSGATSHAGVSSGRSTCSLYLVSLLSLAALYTWPLSTLGLCLVFSGVRINGAIWSAQWWSFLGSCFFLNFKMQRSSRRASSCEASAQRPAFPLHTAILCALCLRQNKNRISAGIFIEIVITHPLQHLLLQLRSVRAGNLVAPEYSGAHYAPHTSEHIRWAPYDGLHTLGLKLWAAYCRPHTMGLIR